MKITDLDLRQAGTVEQIEKRCFSAPWTRQNILDTLQNGHSIFLAAVLSDGQVSESADGAGLVGYISADTVCQTAYINNVAVDIPFRRTGVGKALISALEQREREVGCTEITLEVRSKNLSAKALYQKCGYKKCGERKNYYRNPADNAEIMTKKL